MMTEFFDDDIIAVLTYSNQPHRFACGACHQLCQGPICKSEISLFFAQGQGQLLSGHIAPAGVERGEQKMGQHKTGDTKCHDFTDIITQTT